MPTGGGVRGSATAARDDIKLDDWAWVRELNERSRTLVGHQRINLHPLLEGVEMSGVQAAYTNQPHEIFERSRQPQQLLSRSIQPRSVVQGVGPPAGLAELRVDGRIIARQIIRLDGTYEFFDQFIPSRELTEVEVYLYDRNNLAVPITIIDESRNAAEFLMPDGAFLHQAGFGLSGNLANNIERDRSSVGFYQWRQGVSGRLTLEAGLQNGRRGSHAMVGLVSSLPAGFVFAAGVGGSDNGAMGYDASIDRYSRRLRLRGQMSLQEAGYRSSHQS